MNRRQFIIVAAASGLGGLVASSTLVKVEPKVVAWQLLGAASTTLRFALSGIAPAEEMFIAVSGNALWIDTLRWQNHRGQWQETIVKRNIVPGRNFPLQLQGGARILEFSVTTLPLQARNTGVVLLG